MTITEKHRTEYKLIDQVMNELTQVMQKIDDLEVSAEDNRIVIEDLRRIAMMYRKIIEHLPHRIFIKDVNSVYIFCNETFARDLNISPAEIIGMSDSDFLPEEQALKNLEQEEQILRSGTKVEVEEKHVVSGQELTMLAVKTPVRDDNGDIIALQVVLQDITEEKRRAEEQACRIENLEAQLVGATAENESRKIELERMAARRNQLETEIKDLQANMSMQIALRDAERDRLKEELQQKMLERNEAADLLRKSFTQIQNLMNSAQHITGPFMQDAR
jgi:PAS domain S-box-containing protein